MGFIPFHLLLKNECFNKADTMLLLHQKSFRFFHSTDENMIKNLYY